MNNEKHDIINYEIQDVKILAFRKNILHIISKDFMK